MEGFFCFMNYLGHIYFSKNNIELMYANLFGDFVKGSNLNTYNPIVKEGIQLHREIDSFIGNHAAVKELSKHLSPELPKVAPIAIDIYFDHFLALNWERFHTKQLTGFLEEFYNFQINKLDYSNEKFDQLILAMKEKRWLSEYSKIYSVDKACVFLSNRLSFENALPSGKMVLENNYKEIEQVFFSYMKDAVNYFH